jgi:hypothetical protein
MEASVRVTYASTPASLLSGTRLQINFPRQFVSVSGAFAALLAIYLTFRGLIVVCGCSDLWWYVGLCALGGLAFGVATTGMSWLVFLPMRVHTLYRQNPQLFGDTVLTTDPEGVEIAAPRAISRFSWGEFRGFKENGRVLLLCLSRSVSFAVAKAGMPTADVEALRIELASRLKRL